MALQLSMAQFKQGSYIVVEGKANADFFYIIQKGMVQCSKSSDQGQPVRYGPGDFIGVVPCMSGHSQIETAVALTDVVCISVRRDQYPELIATNTPLALKIIKSFAARMRTMNDILAQIALKNVVQDTAEQIFNVAQFYENAGKLDIAVYAYYQYLKTKPTGPNAVTAKQRFVSLKPRTNAVYFEPTAELTRSYPENVMIFSESQSGAEMFIIKEGEVSISKVVDGNEVVLAVLKQGDMFGEMALLENKPRSASAIAHSACRLMVVNRSNFDQMVSSQPQLISKLTTTLSERLWSMYRQIDNAYLKDPVHKMVDMLCLQLEKSKIRADKPNISWQSDLSAQDLCNMCGIEQRLQPKAIYDFQNMSVIKIINGKVFVKDCFEITKQAAFYKKNNNKG
ncbi:MAG: Crp/Fnr family transcriptional regulator [Treponema sp.]|nr:Crp/Fnr family transcriptional regulator [Treponema sp.]